MSASALAFCRDETAAAASLASSSACRDSVGGCLSAFSGQLLEMSSRKTHKGSWSGGKSLSSSDLTISILGSEKVVGLAFPRSICTDVPSKGYTSTRFLNSFAAARLPIPHCARRPPSAIAEINSFIASSSSQASTNWTCSDPCWSVIQRLVSFLAFDTYGIVYRHISAS